MNKIILIGNLTRDLELKYSKDGLAIANSSLAINEFRGTEKEKTIFIDISFFGKQQKMQTDTYIKVAVLQLLENWIFNLGLLKMVLIKTNIQLLLKMLHI